MTGATSRRALLALGLGCIAGPLRAADAPTGAVEPLVAAPAIPLVDNGGRVESLDRLLLGRPTAVQLMFTSCSSTCPTQGQLFAMLAARQRVAGAQWLSLSIDALGDDAKRLAAWQARFGVHSDWRAAVPRPADADRLCAFLRGGDFRAVTHTTQVFVFDRHARLVWRTGDLPPPAQVEALLARAATLG